METKKCKIVSVIVTCYNSETYIYETIESLINQSYKDIEIIIVNDGSQGDFNSVISTYNHHKNIKFVFNSENKGLFYSRLIGFKASKGDYIAFCDADDQVSFDFYRILVNKLESSLSDFVIADYALKYNDGNSYYLNLDPFFNSNIEICGNDIFDFFMKQNGLCFSYYVMWNKLYKRELFEKCFQTFLEFSELNKRLTMCEDIAFSHLLWITAKKISNVHNIFYYYRQHNLQSTSSISNSIDFIKKLDDIKSVFNFFKRTMKSFKTFEKYKYNFYEWKSLYARIWYSKAVSLGYLELCKNDLELVFDLKNLSPTTSEDHFFISVKTNLNKNFEWLENIKKTICHESTKYVSFDIFDTLITRPLLYPDDLFHLMSEKVNKLIDTSTYFDFHNIRKESEINCRKNMLDKNNCEDITIDQIYEHMSKNYEIPIQITNKIKEYELDTELELCRQRKLGKELYDLAVFYDKTIVFTSDMYLTKNFICKLLNKNGYRKYKEIFVSSEEKVLKSTKNLFFNLLDKLKISSPSSVIHVGDNWNNDVQIPLSLGMKSGLLPNMVERLLCNNPGTYSGNLFKKITQPGNYAFNIDSAVKNFIGLRCMLGLIALNLFDTNILSFNHESDINSSPVILGYYPFGMHLYSITDWIAKKEISKNGTIHFISRDGFLVKKAYEMMAKNKKINYLYFSRKAIIPFILNSEKDIFTLSTFIRPQAMTPKKIRTLLYTILREHSEDYFKNLCLRNNFPIHANFSTETQFLNFFKFIYENLVDDKRLFEYKNGCKKYFSSIISNNDSFFDLGYSGRNEELFSKLFNIHINSYYIHTNTDIIERRKRLSNFNVETFYETSPQMYVLLREYLFAELAPSCIAYEYNNNNIFPIFEDYKRSFHSEFITSTIQKNALSFVYDFINTFKNFMNSIHYRKLDASQPFEFYLHHATDFDKQMFSHIIFEDDIYGGINLNLVTHWKKLQKVVIDEQISTINDLRNKISKLEQENLSLNIQHEKNKDINFSVLIENKYKKLTERMQEQLDDRWLIINFFINKIKKYENVSLDSIKNLDLKDIMKKEPIISPPDFDQNKYFDNYPDVFKAYKNGKIPNAFYHYFIHGKHENRKR